MSQDHTTRRSLRNVLEATHSAADIRRRLEQPRQHSYLKDFIYGAVDGAVTTFAVVSGVAGAGLSSGVVIILGLANLIGDGFSMAAGNFLGTRAEEQMLHRRREVERQHIAAYPEGEREEIRQIFAAKGFAGDDLERVVDVITSDDQQWIDTMIQEEHGLSLDGPMAWRAASTTFAAFVVVGFLPLATFVHEAVQGDVAYDPYRWSAVLTGFAFFAVGASKARFVDQKWYWAGLETLLVGSVAAGLAFGVGKLLGNLV